MSEIYCTCGDTENEHVDGDGPCIIAECGCKGFEMPEDEEDDMSGATPDLNGER